MGRTVRALSEGWRTMCVSPQRTAALALVALAALFAAGLAPRGRADVGYVITDLGTLAGPQAEMRYSYGAAVNDSGQVVGRSSLGYRVDLYEVEHAFRTNAAGA